MSEVVGHEPEGLRSPPALRRRFLASLTKVSLALGLFGSGAVSLFFLLPGKEPRRQPQRIAVLHEDELPRRGVKRVEFSSAAFPGRRPTTHRAFVVKKDGRLFALSARCSHLGCLVEWSRHLRRFVCPCHGGLYDAEGRVVQGPPPGPLAAIPVLVRGGKVYLELDG